jgi:hypothetical protein
MHLDTITLAVPVDLTGRIPGLANSQHDRFRWTLHQALIHAFQKGQIRHLRFLHPQVHPPNTSVYQFTIVERHLEPMLFCREEEAIPQRRR